MATVTVVRPSSGTDIYGDPAAGATETTVTGVALAPRFNEDITGQGRTSVIVGYTLYGPASMDLEPTDRVRYAGDLFEVDGMVGVWTNPYTGRTPGIQAALKRVEG